MERYENFKMFHQISKENSALPTSSLQPKTFTRGELLVLPGQTQRELYFVKAGVQTTCLAAETLQLNAVKINWKNSPLLWMILAAALPLTPIQHF